MPHLDREEGSAEMMELHRSLHAGKAMRALLRMTCRTVLMKRHGKRRAAGYCRRTRLA
jgi:hypothetical protein